MNRYLIYFPIVDPGKPSTDVVKIVGFFGIANFALFRAELQIPLSRVHFKTFARRTVGKSVFIIIVFHFLDFIVGSKTARSNDLRRRIHVCRSAYRLYCMRLTLSVSKLTGEGSIFYITLSINTIYAMLRAELQIPLSRGNCKK